MRRFWLRRSCLNRSCGSVLKTYIALKEQRSTFIFFIIHCNWGVLLLTRGWLPLSWYYITNQSFLSTKPSQGLANGPYKKLWVSQNFSRVSGTVLAELRAAPSLAIFLRKDVLKPRFCLKFFFTAVINGFKLYLFFPHISVYTHMRWNSKAKTQL